MRLLILAVSKTEAEDFALVNGLQADDWQFIDHAEDLYRFFNEPYVILGSAFHQKPGEAAIIAAVQQQRLVPLSGMIAGFRSY